MQTKSIALASLALMLLLGTTLVTPVAAANMNLNKLYGAPSYVLNLLGKKAAWTGGGSYDNLDRHTMMVPETTTGLGGTGALADDTAISVNLTMWITQGAEFGVIDGNGFDDAAVALQLAPGKYAVCVVALGKPGGQADIRGWVYNATDNTYLFMTGMVSVPGHHKKPVWVDATDLLFVSDQEDPYDIVTGDPSWIFDYLTALETALPLGDYLYLWDMNNQNIHHLQLRFYQTG